MKKTIIAAFSACAAMVVCAVDPDTFAFYSFKDGEAGTSAVGVTLANQMDASMHAGSATCSDADATASATFDADAPGPYVYSSALASAEVICSAPQSIYVMSEAKIRAGTIKFADAATEFSKHSDTGFTLEFFVKMDTSVSYLNYGQTVSINAYKRISDDKEQSFIIGLPYQNMSKMACGVGSFTSGDAIHGAFAVPTLNDGKWHHVAFVQDADAATIRIYFDYKSKKSGRLTANRVAEVGAGMPVVLLNETFCGKLSCVRMTKRALSSEEFMLTANRMPSATVSADPDTLAFYPFDDGMAGSSAANATVNSVVNPQVNVGTVTVSAEATASAMFSADMPGKYVFIGEQYAATPIYTNPASIHVTSEIAGQSGSITFTGLGAALSKHHARGHTVEYFMKMDDSDFAAMASHFLCDAGYRQTSSQTSMFNLYMPFSMGASYAYGRQFRFAVGSYSGSCKCTASTGYDLWDGLWHHVAVVESNEVVAATGGTPETTNFFMKVYVDYALRETLKTAGAGPMEVGNVVLGNNVHHGSYSCLKATARMLEPAEFLRVSNCDTYWPKTVFHWTFDGAEGEVFPSVVTNAVVSFHDLNSNVYSSAQAALSGNGSVPDVSYASYSSRMKYGGAPVSDGEGDESPRVNAGSAYLASSSTGETTFRTSAYVRHYSTEPSAYAAGRGLMGGNFTAEGFFKFDQTSWLRDVGAYASGRPRITVMGQTHVPNSESCSTWLVTLQAASSRDNAYLQLSSYDTVAGAKYGNSASGLFVDGRWHHVAVAYDEAAQLLIGYLDYKPFVTNVLSGPLSYGTSGLFSVGLGTSLNNNGFHGWVDEVRYSREFLPPLKFLHIGPPPGTILIFR